ncbi:MAG: hypothetical protein PHS64_06190, partial [Candidatus Omnitrophica bacterium]|nr:hypothetical protein [Candidatus Omnitrophota bacterium]
MRIFAEVKIRDILAQEAQVKGIENIESYIAHHQARVAAYKEDFYNLYFESVMQYTLAAMRWIPASEGNPLRDRLGNVQYLSIARKAEEYALKVRGQGLLAIPDLSDDEIKNFAYAQALKQENNAKTPQEIRAEFVVKADEVFHPFKYYNDLGNKAAIEAVKQFREKEAASGTYPLEYKLKFAIAGGIFDLNNPDINKEYNQARADNALGKFFEKYLYKKAEEKLATPEDYRDMEKFFAEYLYSNESRTIAYLFDNNCEGVFDLEFIQSMLLINDKLTIYAIVKENNVSNDFSLEDVKDVLAIKIKTATGEELFFSALAEQAEYLTGVNIPGDVTKRFKVITKGPNLQGIDLAHLSGQLKAVLEQKDILLLTKGQANCESTQVDGLERLHILMSKGATISSFTGLNKDAKGMVVAYVPKGLSLGKGKADTKQTCPVNGNTVTVPVRNLVWWRGVRKTLALEDMFVDQEHIKSVLKLLKSHDEKSKKARKDIAKDMGFKDDKELLENIFKTENRVKIAKVSRKLEEKADALVAIKAEKLGNDLVKEYIDILNKKPATKPQNGKDGGVQSEIIDKFMEDASVTLQYMDGKLIADGYNEVWIAVKAGRNPWGLSAEALEYLSSMNLDAFKEMLRRARSEKAIVKNSKKGLAITTVGGFPFGNDSRDFELMVDKLRKEILDIAGEKIKFNEEKGVNALHMTLQAITRTKNVDGDDKQAYVNALQKVENKVDKIQQSLASLNIKITENGLLVKNIEDGLLQLAQKHRAFNVKIVDFSYDDLKGSLRFILEPLDNFMDVGGKKKLELATDFAKLPTEAKNFPSLHISFGRASKPLTDLEIERINGLFNKLDFNKLPPFKVDNIKVVFYSHRSLSDIITTRTLYLGKENTLDLKGMFQDAEEWLSNKFSDGGKDDEVVAALNENFEDAYSRRVIKEALLLQDRERAIKLQILAAQALNINSWIKRNVPEADKLRLTVDKEIMLTSDKGESYLDISGTALRSAQDEFCPGFYWRGAEGTGKLGRENIRRDLLFDTDKFYTENENVIIYIMNHGFLSVPLALRRITGRAVRQVSTIHETVFLHDRIPGSWQGVSTGIGHNQHTNLDIKYVTEGSGVQLNIRYGERGRPVQILAQHVMPGSWALALPGYVDS